MINLVDILAAATSAKDEPKASKSATAEGFRFWIVYDDKEAQFKATMHYFPTWRLSRVFNAPSLDGIVSKAEAIIKEELSIFPKGGGF